MEVFTTVPTVELLRRRRNSQKAQSAAEFMVRGDHLSVEKPVHYHDLAALIEDDPRNLKKILDSYPGFVRLAGKPLYFYLPDFWAVAKALDNGLYYPTELPYAISRRSDIPQTVSSHFAPADIVTGLTTVAKSVPTETVHTKTYGARVEDHDGKSVTVLTSKMPADIKTNVDVTAHLDLLTNIVFTNMTPGEDGKLPGDPGSRFEDLNELLGFVATLTRMADK